ncbi:LysR family transcriptional regulator [Tateyamaria sp. SN3-11]|uniref:LysR family transcriptional regulator n=1 Tax=Tateyamaria sp. SN3-11 TaxID=3092147 RepID=UPI0039E7CDD4
MAVTEPGEILIPHAEEMERRVLEVQRRVAGLDSDPSGTVTVSLAPSFAQSFFVPMLSAFTARYPDIQIRVVATNRISDLARQEADVSLRAANQIDDDLVGRRLVDYVTAAFASPDYVAAHPDLMQTGGQGAHWIGWGDDHSWIASSPLPNAQPRHSMPEILMQAEAAAVGLGMAWVPAVLVDLHPGLMRVPGVPTGPGRGLWILLHGDLRRTARVRAFVDFASDWIIERRSLFTS